MAGLGTKATTAIITNGLTGCGHPGTSVCQSGIITTGFSLYCTGEVPPPPVSSGGGPYPRQAWNRLDPGQIQNFYKEVNVEDYYIVPRDQEEKYFRRHKPLKITFKMGEMTVEKEYLIPEKRAQAVVQAFNVVERTKENIDVTVEKVKRVVSNAVVTVKNIRLKK